MEHDIKVLVAKPFLELDCGLAEGPFWEQSENVLRFVDIVNQAVYRVDLSIGPQSLKKQTFDISIGVTAEVEGCENVFVFGGKYGIGVVEKTSSKYQYIRRFWTHQEEAEGKGHRMRANDGAVDSHGRFWVGVLNDPLVNAPEPVGTLFRLDPDKTLHRVLETVTVPNGMSWSLDDRVFYFTDSASRTIFAYDFDPITGSISNRRPFFEVAESVGTVDGHAQDVEGSLWVAVWGGWKVVRVNSQGQVTAEVKVPTRCVTAVAFAGKDIYITSEADPEPQRYPQSVRYQGAVFKCTVGISGRVPNVARIAIGDLPDDDGVEDSRV